MMLSNPFQVDAPVEAVWSLLERMEVVVPCMPGASYLGREGDDHQVGIRMKIGAIGTHFQGVVRIVEQNAAARTVVMRGSGKDTTGKASVTATLTARLEPWPAGGTHVVVDTDLAITGRLAQFGGGVLADISSRLIAQFAANLQQAIRARQDAEPQPSAAAAAEPAGRMEQAAAEPAADPGKAAPPALDLGKVLGAAAFDFVRRFIVMAVLFFVLGWLAGRYL